MVAVPLSQRTGVLGVTILARGECISIGVGVPFFFAPLILCYPLLSPDFGVP